MKIYLEKGKLLNKEWNDDELISRSNDCINIDNNIINIKEINKSIEKRNNNELNIKFYPEEEMQINNFLEKKKNLEKYQKKMNINLDLNLEQEIIISLKLWFNSLKK